MTEVSSENQTYKPVLRSDGYKKIGHVAAMLALALPKANLIALRDQKVAVLIIDMQNHDSHT